MLINKSDYRLAAWENRNNQKRKLAILQNKLDGHRTKNHYGLVSSNNNEYKDIFMDAFENRCCYCGVDFLIVGKKTVQIDHIDSSEPKDNTLKNLAPACFDCNQKKKDICDKQSLASIINPYNSIHNVFQRNDDYSICIKDGYIDNEDVRVFFEKLKLGSQIKRIDYLLSCIRSIKDKQENRFIKSCLSDIYNSLLDKRIMM